MNRILKLEDSALALKAAKAFAGTLDTMLKSGDAARHDVSKLDELKGKPLAVITVRSNRDYELVAGECNYVSRAEPLGGIERTILSMLESYGVRIVVGQQQPSYVPPGDALASVKLGLKQGKVASGTVWNQSHLAVIGPDKELRGPKGHEYVKAATGQKEVALYTLTPEALGKMQKKLYHAGMSMLK